MSTGKREDEKTSGAVSDLLSCPFCGADAIGHTWGPAHAVGCSNEDCSTSPMTENYETRREAAAIWNQRAGSGLGEALTIHRQLFPIVYAADVLEEYLGKNTGDNADWPVSIKGDEQGALKVLQLLQTLHDALKPYRAAKPC